MPTKSEGPQRQTGGPKTEATTTDSIVTAPTTQGALRKAIIRAKSAGCYLKLAFLATFDSLHHPNGEVSLYDLEPGSSMVSMPSARRAYQEKNPFCQSVLIMSDFSGLIPAKGIDGFKRKSLKRVQDHLFNYAQRASVHFCDGTWRLGGLRAEETQALNMAAAAFLKACHACARAANGCEPFTSGWLERIGKIAYPLGRTWCAWDEVPGMYLLGLDVCINALPNAVHSIGRASADVGWHDEAVTQTTARVLGVMQSLGDRIDALRNALSSAAPITTDPQPQAGAASLEDAQPDDKGCVANPADPSAYVAAHEIVAKHSPLEWSLTDRQLVCRIEDFASTGVRWTRPRGKSGKPHPQRRSVHLGDWVKYVERKRLAGGEGDPTESEIAASTSTIRQARLGK